MMIPIRLRNETRLATLLLFSVWLLTLLVNVPALGRRPLAVLTLLPGLAAALHVQHQLIRHLGSNHRPGQDQPLFPGLGAANWLTVLRAGAIVLLGGMLPLAVASDKGRPEALSWTPGLLYLGIALADLLDGWLARQLGRQTELGKRLDMASDAAGLLVASLVAVSLGRLPAAYLFVGLAYYPFIFGIWWRRQRGLPLVALPPRPYGRIIAGMQMGLVGLALLPLLQSIFTDIAACLLMIPLLAGFIRDWLVVSCRLASDSAWEERLGDLLTRQFPLLLRLIILGCGLAMLAADGGGRISMVWQLAFGLSCLLAALAVMGRSAALILTLLLAGHSSPFGASIVAMVLFGAAVGLMLTGTGTFSLWAPEERILYRRDGKNRVDRGASP
jgi:CDP-diacylglycerol---glycerol-3-phosphate 3-phosphatidyltransferase